MPSRRAVLRNGLAGLSLGIGTAGCSALGLGDPPDLSLVIMNFTEETRLVDVRFLRSNERDRTEAVAFSDEYEVPPDRGPDPIDEDIVPTGRYLVQVELRTVAGVSDHYHFYPEGCTGDGEPAEELYVECWRNDEDHPNEGYYFTFQQTVC